ncbi:hypodermin-A-like [Aphidius gifuensis]|uniref:hypodermin-A-like n=1 Tax=Aphidius gifuensis TaxID=684658 RepID=UPI001CDC8339|nr:hypodermin-A-like [Aphidius gifuensis]
MRRIIGGLSTDIREFAYHVSLQHRGHHVCGASILSEFHVLTSASCVLFDLVVAAGNLCILVGSNDEFNSDGLGTYYNVRYIIYHPDYSPRLYWKNDIAILKLESPINFSSDYTNIEAIQISNILLSAKSTTVVCGWGDDSVEPRESTRNLKKIHVMIKGEYFCQRYADFPVVNENKICGTTLYPNSFITLGDGGSGIVRNRMLVGVISVFTHFKPLTSF